MSVLALDLGAQTGWALKTETARLSGSQSLESKFSGAGMRYLNLRRFLDSKHQENGLTEVHYELVRRHKSEYAAKAYGGYLATLQSWCEENQVPFQDYSVQEIKIAATGKGNASKAAMIRAAEAEGCEPADDNQADAWCILSIVCPLSQEEKLDLLLS